MGDRLNWDEFFLVLAAVYSTRGTCDRLRTACILVKDKRIVGAGYNGAVSGLPNCDDIGHLMIDNHCLRTLHGEQNALANAQGEDLREAIAYVIATPCIGCVKELLQYGIRRIVYVGSYSNAQGKEHIEQLCRDKGVSLENHVLDAEGVAGCFEKVLGRLQGPGGALKSLPPIKLEYKVQEKI